MLVGDKGSAGGVRIGLRTKLILAFALQALLVAIVVVAFEQYRVRRAVIGQTVDQGAAIAHTIESTAAYYVLFGLTDDLKKIVDDLRRLRAVQYADFMSGDGKVLASSDAPPLSAIQQEALGRT